MVGLMPAGVTALIVNSNSISFSTFFSFFPPELGNPQSNAHQHLDKAPPIAVNEVDHSTFLPGHPIRLSHSNHGRPSGCHLRVYGHRQV